MSSPYRAFASLSKAVIRNSSCSPSALLPDETAAIEAEVSLKGGEPPAIVEMEVRSQAGEIVSQGHLEPVAESRYQGTWSPEGRTPGIYEVFLRLPGAERWRVLTLTLLPREEYESFSAGIRQREQAAACLAENDTAGAVKALTEAIRKYRIAAQPAVMAEVMLDLAGLRVKMGEIPKASSLYREVLALREQEGDEAGAAYCRTRITALKSAKVKALEAGF